jgi:hypothetical protein
VSEQTHGRQIESAASVTSPLDQQILGRPFFVHSFSADYFRVVASLDRKRLGTKVSRKTSWTRGVFDEEASRKPLAFAADAVNYGI